MITFKSDEKVNNLQIHKILVSDVICCCQITDLLNKYFHTRISVLFSIPSNISLLSGVLYTIFFNKEVVGTVFKYMFLILSFASIVIPIRGILRNYSELLKLLFRNFEFWFIVVQVLSMFISAVIMWSDDIVKIYFSFLWSISVLYVTLTDSAPTKVREKMLAGVIPAALMMLLVIINVSYINKVDKIININFIREFQIDVTLFFTDRVSTIIIFFLKYIYKLITKPEEFIIIKNPIKLDIV